MTTEAIFHWLTKEEAAADRVTRLALGEQFGSQDELRERYGDTVPLDEPVISPVAMFRSNLLVTVAEQ